MSNNYNIKYNKDDSVIRQIFAGLLADLNEKIYYYQQTAENQRDMINIPFMYAIAGDEAFLQQHFFNDTVRDPEGQFAKTNYEKLPRGIINLVSMNIDSASLLNKYVYGTYNRLVGQEMKTFHSQFQMIPITLGFDVEILVDSQLDTFKVAESLIKRLYKNNTFNIEAGHPDEATFRVACYYKMPEDYTQERPIEFSFDDDKRYKVTFSLEALAFIPSIDFANEMFAGNRMFKIENNISTTPTRMDLTGFYEKPSGKLNEKEEQVRKSRQDTSFDKNIPEEN
jgi:hypothetical protein